MHNRILISINTFNHTGTTLEYGLQLAKTLNRSVLLIDVKRVAVATMPDYATGYAEEYHSDIAMAGELLEFAEERMKEITERAKTIWPHVDYDVELGFLEQSLSERAKEEQPFMVVLERTNEYSTMNELFGTVESRISEGVDSPVLVVPNEILYRPVNHILYLLPFPEGEHQDWVSFFQIVNELQAKVTIGLVFAEASLDAEKVVADFQQTFGRTDIDFIPLLESQLENHLENTLVKKDVDWLAFQHRSTSFLGRLVNHFTNQRLILQSEIPVLVF